VSESGREEPVQPPEGEEPGEGAPIQEPSTEGAATEAAVGPASAPARAWAWVGASSWRVKAALAALAALLIVVLVAALAGDRAGLRVGGSVPASEADAVPYDGRSPRAPAGEEQRVIVALPRPALGELRDARRMSADEQRRYVASLEREAEALRSALGARGVRLRDVVSFERTFDGFAATVRSRQLADLASLGVRPQPVRRLYPALGEPVPARPAGEAARTQRRWDVAVLAGGVERAPGIERGYDAVDRDRNPAPGSDPRRGSRTEVSGTALAALLSGAGARVTPIRIASLSADPDLPAPEELATSDTLLAGLEHAVDPDGDGATDDHVPVALVGVNAPYAGFGASAEAQAARGAAGLGTLVVAGVGQEGPAAPGSGTIGSPAAGADVLAVGALAGSQTTRVALTVGDVKVRAAVLGGRPAGGRLETAGPLDTADLSKLLVPGGPALQGRLVVVRAGENPPARAAAAAAAGARAVLLADARKQPLAAMPAGRVGVPVLGVTGEAAEDVLRAPAGTKAEVGRLEPAGSGAAGSGGAGSGAASGGSGAAASGGAGSGAGSGGAGAAPAGAAGRGGVAARLSPFSSQGPAASGAAKPDLVAPGAAIVRLPRGAAELVGGTAVAAARAAVAAARLASLHPEASATELRAMLAGAADPAGLPVSGAGAGILRPDPVVPRLVIEPRKTAQFRLTNGAGTPLSVKTSAESGRADPARLDLKPGQARTVRVTPVAAPPPSGYALGRLLVSSSTGGLAASLPWAIAGDEPEPVPVGRLELQRGPENQVRGVRFPVGAFERGPPTKIVLADRLELELLRNGQVVRRLTPPGGARELLPAEYGYTLERSVLASLRPGTYRFRATARAPRQRHSTVVLSEPFEP
jgi:hypothetical protein